MKRWLGASSFEVPPSPFAEFPGYATAEIAFESLAAPNSHGSVPPSPGSDIRVVLVSADPGLTLFDGLTAVPIGGEVTLGPPFFHYLPVWSIEAGPLGGVYDVTLIARDANGVHADSLPFEISFTAVPAPGAAALGAAGLAAACRRRRR